MAAMPRCFDGLHLEEIISKGSLDFDEWTSLISDVEKTYPDDMEKICLIYDHFLSNFPLCYGYWRKYAAHMTRLCTIDKVVEVFEKAVSAATYSLGMWVDYCTFAMSAFEDPSDIRRLFKRAISFIGKDYLCHTLWDKYIHFEFSQQQWVSLAHIYVQTLKFPTKKLHQYYDSFKKLLTLLEGSTASLDIDNSPKELQSETCFDGKIPICCKGEKIYCIIKDMMDSSAGLASSIALKKYRIIGEQLYHSACELDSKISFFEANIQRHHFHVRPLDAGQLQNWHDYLDFIELQEDFDWAVKLYERCLIPCANYPEYWMRYVDFMETKGGREIANYSLDRATEIYLKRVPAIHLFNARFKEQIGDVLAARAAFVQSGKETDSGFVENVISKANMEKRLGNMESACSIYKEAIEMAAATEKLHVLPILYVHYSRLKYMSSSNADAARDILIGGIKSLPGNKLLLEELIKLSMMHGGPVPMAVIDSIIVEAISPRPDGSHVLGAEDAESISNLYLEFVDYCGTIHDIRKARNRHTKLFRESARIDLHQLSAICRSSLSLVKDKKHDTSVAMTNQPSRDSSSDLHASLHPQDQDKKTLSQKYDVSVREEPRDNDPENNVSSADLAKVKEESTKVPNHFKTNCSESGVSSETLLNQTASGNQPSQALQASSKEDDDYSQGKYELEPKELKPLSPTSTSPNRLESTLPDSGPMASQEEEDAIPQGFKPKSRAVMGGHTASQDNSARTQNSESPQIHVEKNSSSYSRFHQDHRSRRPLLSPQSSRNTGGNMHPMRNTGKLRRGTKYGHRGNKHRKQQHQQQLSRPEIHPTKGGALLPVTPGYPSQSVLQIQQGQNQFQAITTTTTDFVTAQSWPIQNIQMQNSSSQSQPLANNPSQVSQFAMQGNGQYGYLQNGREYNQMWQYYYYQQQQQLQLQQHYAQLQQQSFQQEESQQQNPLEHLQPQQLQQLQHVLLLQQPQPPQQQEHPVHEQPSTQGGSSPVAVQGRRQGGSNAVADQGPAIAMSQDQGSISSQQACEPATDSSLVPHLGQTSTHED